LILERDRGLGVLLDAEDGGAWPTTIPAAMTIMIAIRIAPIRFSVPNVSLELIGVSSSSSSCSTDVKCAVRSQTTDLVRDSFAE